MRILKLAASLLLPILSSLGSAAQDKPFLHGETYLKVTLEVRSAAHPDDIDPYLRIFVIPEIRKHWYQHVPYTARAPLMKKGTVTVEFESSPDGTIAELHQVQSSGEPTLDRGVMDALAETGPLARPSQPVKGKPILVRGEFTYNSGEQPALPYNDIPSMFLPYEFRVGVKLNDPSRWAEAGGYIEVVIAKVRTAWYGELKSAKIPASATATSIEVLIQPDGTVADPSVNHESGDANMDKAALKAVSASAPFPKLPANIADKPLGLQLNFRYDPQESPSESK